MLVHVTARSAYRQRFPKRKPLTVCKRNGSSWLIKLISGKGAAEEKPVYRVKGLGETMRILILTGLDISVFGSFFSGNAA
jgi:hypothetical protein